MGRKQTKVAQLVQRKGSQTPPGFGITGLLPMWRTAREGSLASSRVLEPSRVACGWRQGWECCLSKMQFCHQQDHGSSDQS